MPVCENSRNGRSTKMESVSKLSMRDIAGSVFAPNLINNGRRNYLPFPPAVSTPEHHVTSIILRVAQVEVVRAHTSAIIAFMQHQRTRGDWPIRENISQPVRPPRSIFIAYIPIAASDVVRPKPTRGCLLNLAPKARLRCCASARVGTCSRAESLSGTRVLMENNSAVGTGDRNFGNMRTHTEPPSRFGVPRLRVSSAPRRLYCVHYSTSSTPTSDGRSGLPEATTDHRASGSLAQIAPTSRAKMWLGLLQFDAPAVQPGRGESRGKG